jgi:hypothetical protein
MTKYNDDDNDDDNNNNNKTITITTRGRFSFEMLINYKSVKKFPSF